MPLAIQSRDNSFVLLTKNSSGVALPWALIKDQIFLFADALFQDGVFFALADDSDTAAAIFPAMMKSNNIEFGLKTGKAKLLCGSHAKEYVSKTGKRAIGAKWDLYSSHVMSFLDYLYLHNVYIVVTEDLAAKQVCAEAHSQGRNVLVRLRAGT
jgi:hypothetical protein